MSKAVRKMETVQRDADLNLATLLREVYGFYNGDSIAPGIHSAIVPWPGDSMRAQWYLAVHRFPWAPDERVVVASVYHDGPLDRGYTKLAEEWRLRRGDPLPLRTSPAPQRTSPPLPCTPGSLRSGDRVRITSTTPSGRDVRPDDGRWRWVPDMSNCLGRTAVVDEVRNGIAAGAYVTLRDISYSWHVSWLYRDEGAQLAQPGQLLVCEPARRRVIRLGGDA